MNVIDSKKTSYNVIEKLGTGSQGTTYLLEDRKYIAKIFNKSVDSTTSKSKINFLINLSLDKKYFAVPLKEIIQPYNGYIAEFASGMELLSNLKHKPNNTDLAGWYGNTGGLIRRYKILIHLASLLRTLHSKGLAYCDLSPNNIFVSQSINSNNIFIIDLDNLRYKSNVLNTIYTPFYGAPELVNYLGCNSTMSDSYSFAVLAYELLTLNHPLIGDYVTEGEPELEEQALAGKLPWVDNLNEKINKRTTGLPSDKVIPNTLMNLFKRNFEDGLNSPLQRPTIAEWFDKLNLSLNELLHCGKCGLYYPFNNTLCCTFCSSLPKQVTRIQMRRWEQTDNYNSNTNRIESNFTLQSKVYDEILIDENTTKEIAAFNFLLSNTNGLHPILSIEQQVENNENTLRLTPMNETTFLISPREGNSEGVKSNLLDRPRKIRIVDKNQPDRKKYMLHLQDLSFSQRVLTID